MTNGSLYKSKASESSQERKAEFLYRNYTRDLYNINSTVKLRQMYTHDILPVSYLSDVSPALFPICILCGEMTGIEELQGSIPYGE